MANEYGLELVIPDGFIEKVQKADEELEYTALQAEETKERVIKAFKEMGDQGVDYFLKKLKEMNTALDGISSKNINLKNLENSTKNIAQGADDVVRIADAFGQVGNASTGMDGAIKNINTQLDGMWERLKQVRNDITLYYEAIGTGHKEEMQFGQEGLKKANEEAEQLMKRIEALEVTRAKLEQSGNVSALSLEQKRHEAEMLDEAYRTGTSELQKQADEEKRLAKVSKEQAQWEEKQNKERLNFEKEYVGWFDKAVTKQERINRLKEEEKRKTYEGALNFSQNATSIAQETQAIKYLTTARDNLSKTDADYQKKLATLNGTINQHRKSIADAKGETQRLEREERSLINTSDQLRRKFGLLFSVSAIEGYMKKMVEVRGEFELQKVALTAILQNKEKADQLWAQTQQLALKSPFRLQQLVTFTKQLAAYQVQAESLYDTTKRLADVSAGLGVDMGRLILAFGQVKAANYLRSAEIRQFTEAGINMLGELSKLYTEIEGKIVSVGEVQARVQKRLVSFSDVEEVFKRMTDAGGMFYNMQEKQAETLKGMVAKLSDALDIMLNQIGEATQGVLKGVVQTILNILQSWEDIGRVAVPIITVLVTRMVALKAATMFMGKGNLMKGFVDSLKLALTWIKKDEVAMKTLRATTEATSTAFAGWTAIISAAVIVLWEVGSAIAATRKEQKELNRASLEGIASADKLLAKYESLVSTIKDQTKPYQEQKEALEELKRTYSDILPAEMLEINNIRTMGDEYTKARDAIYSYMSAKTKQKQLEIIESNEGADLQSAQDKVVKRLTQNLKEMLGEENVQRHEVSAMIVRIVEAQKQGLIQTVDEAEELLKNLIKETYGMVLTQDKLYELGLKATPVEGEREFIGNVTKAISTLLEDGKAYNDAINEITNANMTLLTSSDIRLDEARKKFEETHKDLKKAFESIQDFDLLTPEQKDDALASLKEFYTQMGEEIPDWVAVRKDPLKFDEETRKFNQLWLKAMLNDVQNAYQIVEEVSDGATQVLDATFDKFREKVQKDIDTQNIERWQKAISSAIREYADENEISLEGMQSIVMKSGQTLEDYFKGIEGDVNTLKQEIGQEGINKTIKGYEWTQKDEEALEKMKEQLALFEYILSLYYDAKKADKASDKEDREAFNLLKERVKLIQEANKEYKKNLQYFTKEEALAKTISSYKNAFQQAGISELLGADYLTDEGVLKALAKLPMEVGGKLEDEALQYMADTKAKVKVEIGIDKSQNTLKNLKTQVEGLFNEVDIFEDLSKIGFTEEEVKRIFGLQVTNTEQLRAQLESMKDEFVGTKAVEDYNAFMRKIDEIEDKQNVERLKRYEKYLKTMMSETAEVRIQALQDIQDVIGMKGRSSEEKEAIIEGINREAEKKIQEQQWKSFQESDDYQLLFSDLEHLSTSTAARLKDVLDNLRTSLNELTPHQLRQIQAQYEKLDEQIIKHNPFDAVRKSMKDIEGLASESDLNNIMLSLSQQKDGYQSQIDDLDLILSMKEKGIKFDTLDAQTLDRVSSLINLSNEELAVRRMEQQELLDGIMEEMGFTEEQINKYKRLRKAMSEAQNTWKSVMSETKNTLTNIKGAYEAMTDGEQSITLEIVDAGIALADASYQAIQLFKTLTAMKDEAPALGAALNTALGIIGLIATAVQTIMNVINMLKSAHDDALEDDIKQYERRVNQLADAYDRLSEKISKAYSFAKLAMATNQTLTNQQEQIAGYENMIEAERAKKKSDSEKIDEWTSKIDDLRRSMEETKTQAVMEAGGLGGEYKDAAQGFVDAWMQAYRETGNGLDALNEHFQDFLWDIAGKQLLLRAADKFFEPLFAELDKRMTADTSAYDQREQELLSKKNKIQNSIDYLGELLNDDRADKRARAKIQSQIDESKRVLDEYDSELANIESKRAKAIQEALQLDEADFEALKKQYEASGKNFDEFAQKFLSMLGFKGGEGQDALSGLQKGIQGVTEQTAEVVEAYLNTIRFFVNDTNNKLASFIESFSNTEGVRNPILSELKSQSKMIETIRDALNSVISLSGWPQGGNALKIIMASSSM